MSDPDYPTGAMIAKSIQVIETVTPIGAGVAGDPHRYLTEYWTAKGELLAKHDPTTCTDSRCSLHCLYHRENPPEFLKGL